MNFNFIKNFPLVPFIASTLVQNSEYNACKVWVRMTREGIRGQDKDDISLLVSNEWKVETEKAVLGAAFKSF